MTWKTWNATTIRELEHASIRGFVASCSEHLTGRVLDYGCGKQPYRDLVEAAGGQYTGFDRTSFPANVSGENIGGGGLLVDRFETVLCTQVIQYAPDPTEFLLELKDQMRPFGALILTYPTGWEEVEPSDLWRFTTTGIRRLLQGAHYRVERAEVRAVVNLGGFRFPLGGAALAWA